MSSMQSLGYAFVYDKSTNDPIHVVGEISGLLKEDCTIKDRYPDFDPATMDVVEFAHGENREQIEQMGSWYVEDGDIFIVPRFTVTVDRDEIEADGEDVATITVHAPQDASVAFTIDGEDYDVVTDAEGNASLDFATEVVGEHVISISADRHGQGGVVVHAA